MAIKDKEIIKEALDVLGKKNVAFIAHSGSFPSENGLNTGFGTVTSKSAEKLFDFLSTVFNAVQLGPMGKTKSCDASPYTGTIFSKNPLLIDLQKLTTDEYYNLLSEKTFNEICCKNPQKNNNRTAYNYIYIEQEKALREVFENYKIIRPQKLIEDFMNFKKENSFWLENDSLYQALSIENENDYWPLWANEDDKNLLNPKNNTEKERFDARIVLLKEKYSDEIEFYGFTQFLANLQYKKIKKYALEKGIRLIADRQVSFSDRDFWAYQSYFLEGWSLGCPPDMFSDLGQAWGFPVFNPEKIFNLDGSLGDAGNLLKTLYKKMFTENTGGVRIDHLVGLIDPWVYKSDRGTKPEDGAGRLYSSPEHDFLKKFAIANLEDLDENSKPDSETKIKYLTEEQIKKYGAFVEKIVIAAAQEVGLDKNAIVCENLGTLTYPVAKVFEKYDLLGMSLTEIVEPENPNHPYRCKNIVPNCWALVGSHDNKPVSLWAKDKINTAEGLLHAKFLAEDLFPDSNQSEKDEICKLLHQNSDFLAYCKLVELFACKAENIQIFFTDFFGINETYNIPSTFGDNNWSLRIPDDYQNLYDENISRAKALNLPLILKDAIIARGNDFACKHLDIIEKLNEVITNYTISFSLINKVETAAQNNTTAPTINAYSK